jgi:hypothetical protein
MSEENVTATSAIGVIRLRLPYTDSRSLSQAWFSALHLESDAKAPAVTRRRAKPSVSGKDAVALKPPAPPERSASPPRSRPAATRVRTAGPAGSDATGRAARERTRPAAPALDAARSYPPVRAAFAFGLDGARVHILVRREGATLHVLALCAPRHVELVRRALACADFHLRARGDAVCSSVRAFGVQEVCA